MRPRPLSQVALHLDPQTLRILVAIEDYGSFSSAATAVNLVPSAVSRRVQELESAVGLDLVKRSPRSVEFTAAGKRLLIRVRRILDEVDAAISELDSIGIGVGGVLRIATSMFALHGNLPNELANFRTRYPRVELEFQTLPSQDIIAALQRGEIDVGVLAARGVPEGLRYRTYCAEMVVLMVPRDHRFAGSKSVCFDDLSREELSQLPAGTDIQQILDEQAERSGAKLKRSYRVGSLDVPIEESWSQTQLLIAIRKSQPETSPGFRLFSELAATG